MSPRRSPYGFTLVELLIVIAIIAILAATVIPGVNTNIHDQLESAARVMASDLAYARSLAVANDSNYRVTFDLANDRYILKHSGTNAALDALPTTAFHDTNDPVDQHIVNLDELPRIGAIVKIARVVRVGSSIQDVVDVEFGPLGGTTRGEYTVVLLSAGEGGDRRRAFVTVNPVTGLATIARDAHDMPDSLAADAEAIDE